MIVQTIYIGDNQYQLIKADCSRFVVCTKDERMPIPDLRPLYSAKVRKLEGLFTEFRYPSIRLEGQWYALRLIEKTEQKKEPAQETDSISKNLEEFRYLLRNLNNRLKVVENKLEKGSKLEINLEALNKIQDTDNE